MSESPVEYVERSEARTEVLAALKSHPQSSKSDVAEVVDIAASSAYRAVERLRENGYLTTDESGNGYTLTARGHAVLAEIKQSDKMTEVVDDEYWSVMDLSVLPDQFQEGLVKIGPENRTVLREREGDQRYPVRTLANDLDGAGKVDVVTPIYDKVYEEAVDDVPGSRVVVTPEILDALEGMADEQGGRDVIPWDNFEWRVSDVEYAVGVGAENTYCTLPKANGKWPRHIQQLHGDEAAEWASRVFEYEWRHADPIEEHLCDYKL